MYPASGVLPSATEQQQVQEDIKCPPGKSAENQNCALSHPAKVVNNALLLTCYLSPFSEIAKSSVLFFQQVKLSYEMSNAIFHAIFLSSEGSVTMLPFVL